MSIRFKLTTILIAVILVANSLLSFTTVCYFGHVWLDEVQTRVQRNLNVARAVYGKHVEMIATFLRGTTVDRDLIDAVRQNDTAKVASLVSSYQRSGGIDIVTLLDPRGRVLCRARGPKVGDELASDPLVGHVLQERRLVMGTVVYSREQLLAEGGDLADRARVTVTPTAASRPTADQVREDGMIAAAALPLLDERGETLAILYGGNLINRRHEIVDAIKQDVFPNELYRGKDIGTVTIFQRDLRIATNVRAANGKRAVGTLLSASVCEEVLDRGNTWAAPAFVVNDWYITAYEPMRDPDGRIIGALYVGLLRAPFVRQWNTTLTVFLTIVVAATVASLLLLLVANHLVLSPIRSIVAMAQKVIGGDLSARLNIRPPGEMGMLCWAIDSMAQAVAEREEMLKQSTRQQLGRSEQLASVGRLAAGVAHEINNPLVGVLAFADMLREKENMDDQDRQDLELIIRETKRVRDIVRGLLDFARETPSVKARLNINDVICQTIRLLGKRDAFQNIYVVDDLSDNLPFINGDRNQLQQVVMNLVLNACEAMPQGGTLMLRTSATDKRAIFEVTDTGVGIKQEDLDKIFEPFFTTKPVGKGTGLGLSVSYGIIQQHGGTLEVQSDLGRGTTFTISLPLAHVAESDGAPAAERAVAGTDTK